MWKKRPLALLAYGWLGLFWSVGVFDQTPAATRTATSSDPGRSIAACLAEAAPGDTVFVRAGLYREGNLIVRVPLVIRGEAGAIIDCENTREGITVRAGGVVVRDLAIQNIAVSFIRDNAAVRVEASANCEIRNCEIENAFFAIYLAASSSCRIIGNRIRGHAISVTHAGNAIHSWKSRDLTIDSNEVSGHRDGIYLEFARHSVVRYNTSEGNMRYGLHFMFSDSCLYESNNFRRNGAGVAVMYSRHVAMLRNHFIDSWGSSAFGLLLKDISHSAIVGNTLARNTVGIYAEGSDWLTVKGNDFISNGWAVKIMSNCAADTFTANNFTTNAFAVSTNSRFSENVFKGNFWSDYKGYDLNRDGVGDIPFRPVSLFSYIIERQPVALTLLRSFLVDILDAAERVAPVLSPKALIDSAPAMRPLTRHEG